MALITKKNIKRFYLHSIGVEIIGPGADRLSKDFDYFTDRPDSVLRGEDSRFSITLEIFAEDPHSHDLPENTATHIFKDCALYLNNNSLTYDFFGNAHLKINRSNQSSHGMLKCNDSNLVEEIGFLFLQTEISRFLEMQGLHRVQALGIGLPSGKSALILLPSGAGKSTLALELLKHDGFRLLSDDSPLLDRLGNVHPFPLRLAFRVDAKLPEQWVGASSVLERKKNSPRLLIPVSILSPNHLPRPTEFYKPGFLIVANRHSGSREPHLSKLSRVKSSIPFVRDLMVGYGLPNVSESYKNIKELPEKAPNAISRIVASTAFAARAKTLKLELCHNFAQNAQYLVEELRKLE